MNVLIFGGTSEGRGLAAALSRADAKIGVTLSVATEFGRDTAACGRDAAACGGNAAADGVTILTGRLGEEEIARLIERGGFDYVIDATHPYAVSATENIRSACRACGSSGSNGSNEKYLRLRRPESAGAGGVTYVPSAAGAAEWLAGRAGGALLTIGSKELEPFTRVANYAERFFVRVLPMRESLDKALTLGFKGSNILCMQGPFSREMNEATLRMTGAEYLVTKDSGGAGGFGEKISAARALGREAVVIARPAGDETGYTFAELLEIFNIKMDGPNALAGPQARRAESGTAGERGAGRAKFFPIFTDIRGKRALVTGGGRIAERRIKVLASFGAEVAVISPTVTEYIARAASEGAIRLTERKYRRGDISGERPFLVVAATDDRQANRGAMLEAAGLGIPVSVADRREECTFYFPAIAESGDYTAGLVSVNGDHAGAKRMAEEIRRAMGHEGKQGNTRGEPRQHPGCQAD